MDGTNITSGQSEDDRPTELCGAEVNAILNTDDNIALH